MASVYGGGLAIKSIGSDFQSRSNHQMELCIDRPQIINFSFAAMPVIAKCFPSLQLGFFFVFIGNQCKDSLARFPLSYRFTCAKTITRFIVNVGLHSQGSNRHLTNLCFFVMRLGLFYLPTGNQTERYIRGILSISFLTWISRYFMSTILYKLCVAV